MQLVDFRKERERQEGTVSHCSRHQNITAALEGPPRQMAAYSRSGNRQPQAVRIMETMPTDDKKVAVHARMSAASWIMPTWYRIRSRRINFIDLTTTDILRPSS